MQKVTQKLIRGLIADGIARDVRGEYDEYDGDWKAFHERYLGREKVLYSCGIYGLNGGVWRTKGGELIACPSRCETLFTLDWR